MEQLVGCMACCHLVNCLCIQFVVMFLVMRFQWDEVRLSGPRKEGIRRSSTGFRLHRSRKFGSGRERGDGFLVLLRSAGEG